MVRESSKKTGQRIVFFTLRLLYSAYVKRVRALRTNFLIVFGKVVREFLGDLVCLFQYNLLASLVYRIHLVPPVAIAIYLRTEKLFGAKIESWKNTL